jgi:2-dehydropantoate 2-reductase
MLNGHAHFATLDARFGAARVAGGLARISGMLGPNGEILHSGASGVSFGERDGKAAAQGSRRARRGLQEGRHRWRHQPRHQPGPLGQVGDAGRHRLDVCRHARHRWATSSPPRMAPALMREILEECRKVAAAEGYRAERQGACGASRPA